MKKGKSPSHRGGYIFLMLVSLAAVGLGCFAAFAIFIKGPEEVLVPDVVDKPLEEALQDMQEKELYAKLTLRHSTEKKKGVVIEQTPPAGSIRRGYSRVSLVVSEGPLVDRVADYKGMTLEEVRLSVAAQFAGQAQPLIIIGQPMYKEDDTQVGTVLAQEPEALTPISKVTTVKLVVSSGNGRDTISVPDINGMGLEAAMSMVQALPLVFDYTARPPQEGETPNTVVEVHSENGSTLVEQWSHISVTLNLSEGEEDGKRYGIMEATAPIYPKPVNMRLAAIALSEEEASQGMDDDAWSTYATEGRRESTLATFMHIGGHITVPYCTTAPSLLLLYAEDTVIRQMVVE